MEHVRTSAASMADMCRLFMAARLVRYTSLSSCHVAQRTIQLVRLQARCLASWRARSSSGEVRPGPVVRCCCCWGVTGGGGGGRPGGWEAEGGSEGTAGMACDVGEKGLRPREGACAEPVWALGRGRRGRGTDLLLLLLLLLHLLLLMLHLLLLLLA